MPIYPTVPDPLDTHVVVPKHICEGVSRYLGTRPFDEVSQGLQPLRESLVLREYLFANDCVVLPKQSYDALVMRAVECVGSSETHPQPAEAAEVETAVEA